MEVTYNRQVTLLLNVLPEVAKEKCFAPHGGTAINLFVRDMPRLSVKLEVNLVNRGALSNPREMTLCSKAQNDFEAFCVMPVVSFGQLFGGKIIAALDRQHPRDLFDVKYLLDTESFTHEVKEGFMLYLLCSDRPINEIIMPNFQDHRAAMANQFTGMTDEVFTYEDYERVRAKLVQTLHANLSEEDKAFLLSIKNVTPDWSIYDFARFPAIRWKLQNLQNLKDKNPDRHLQLYETLEKKLKETHPLK